MSSYKSDVLTCKKLIIYNFCLEDLKYCLHNVQSFTSGTKDNLKRRLRTILECEKTQMKAIKAILERGVGMNYCSESVLKNFPESLLELKSDKPKNDDVVLVNSINMRKLYFHKNVKNISGWRLVNSHEVNLPFLFDFCLPNSVRNSILFPASSISSKTCLMLRCAQITQDNGDGPFHDYYPIGMRLFINGFEFTNLLPREIGYSSIDVKNRQGTPTILNAAIQRLSEIGKNNECLRMEVRFDRIANKNQTFGFAVFTSNIKTVDEVFQETVSREKIGLEKFENDLKDFMSGGDELILESIKVYLHSSISLERIKIPFRGKNCTHIAPDDLETYIKINENSETWLCKSCKSPCTPDDVMIDEFFTEILKRHPDVEEIELLPEMSYRLPGRKRKLTIGNYNHSQDDTDDEIIVIDSDDESVICLY